MAVAVGSDDYRREGPGSALSGYRNACTPKRVIPVQRRNRSRLLWQAIIYNYALHQLLPSLESEKLRHGCNGSNEVYSFILQAPLYCAVQFVVDINEIAFIRIGYYAVAIIPYKNRV